MRNSTMLNLSKILLLMLLATALGGCYGGRYVDLTWTGISGSGRVITETRDVSGFTSLTVSGGARVNVEQTGQESLSVTSDDDVLPHLISEVHGGRLYVEFERHFGLANSSGLTVNVTVKELHDINLNGGINAEIKGLDTDQFRVNVSGGSVVRLAGQAEYLEVNVSGASFVQLAGKADQQRVNLSGASRYDAEHLQARRATVQSSGAGYAIVQVSEMLNADISGLGYVEYIGNPTVNREISGLGTVRRSWIESGS